MSNAGSSTNDRVAPKESPQQHSEQHFSIQPHPAKTNDPHDLEGPQLGAGLTNKPEISAHHAHGPQVLSKDIARSLEQPASREELHRRAEELNSS